MQVALELFFQKGYEHTTIMDIINEMGVSKGAFYHYFDSKEDVIVAIAQEFTEKAVRMIKSIFDQPGIDAVEKMNQAFEAINEYKIYEGEWRTKLRAAIENEDNLKLQYKIYHFTKNEVIDLYTELIESGVKEGVFGDPVNSCNMAEFFVDTIFSLNTAFHGLEKKSLQIENLEEYGQFRQKVEETIRFYEIILERIFKLQKGSFNLRAPYLKRFQKKV